MEVHYAVVGMVANNGEKGRNGEYSYSKGICIGLCG